MQFSFIIQGSDELEKRFIDKMNTIPNMQMNLIHCFGNLLALTLDATPNDNLALIGFNASRLNEEPITDSTQNNNK